MKKGTANQLMRNTYHMKETENLVYTQSILNLLAESV